jgi:GNAT superfamily N-acetyltransferase
MEIKIVDSLNPQHEHDVSEIKKLAFSEVSETEIEEDFYHPESAHVLAYERERLVGWAGIHETEQIYEGKIIRIGGYGICTHPDWQRRGIASRISAAAMEYLRKQGCDIGFLSVDTENTASVNLHKKNGFIIFPRKYAWTNLKGECKQDEGAMIAPINSKELFEYIMNSTDVLYIGDGYW